MLEIILFCIFAYTLSSIVVQQRIFEEPRNWLKQCSTENPNYLQKKMCQFISCMFCTGFWSGVILSFIFPILANPGLGILAVMFVHGLLGAFSSYLLHLLMGLLIKKAEEKGIAT